MCLFCVVLLVVVSTILCRFVGSYISVSGARELLSARSIEFQMGLHRGRWIPALFCSEWGIVGYGRGAFCGLSKLVYCTQHRILLSSYFQTNPTHRRYVTAMASHITYNWILFQANEKKMSTLRINGLLCRESASDRSQTVNDLESVPMSRRFQVLKWVRI